MRKAEWSVRSNIQKEKRDASKLSVFMLVRADERNKMTHGETPKKTVRAT